MREAVRARYREPWRRYHDERHLDAVLAHVNELAAHAADFEAVRWAAYFYDAVDESGTVDNEWRSAELARAWLTTAGEPIDVVDEVVRLILVTQHHDPADTDANAAVLSDADLAVLAGSPDAYARYASDIRAEWSDLDDASFNAGRAAILREFLGRPQLFRTPTGQASWESTARHNLATELALLAAS